ncbi:MAG: peptidylprolyl isomerase [Eggerthellaceae bacterium]|nr:peptidylprolyl isomerase [Eggerthellaceae bacterium]
MNTKKMLKTMCAFAFILAGVGVLASCTNQDNSSGDSSTSGLTGGVAATVNGVEISEDTVTSQVQNFRASYGYTDDDSWGTYLASSSSTPDSIREQILDTLIDNQVTKDAIADNNIEVSSSEIDDQVNKVKGNYSTDAAWQQALAAAGWTEDSYRSEIEFDLGKTKLKDAVAPLQDPTQEETLNYINMYLSSLDGAKRSSHILFNSTDQATAQSVLDQINSGELDFATAAQQYSIDTASAVNGGDVGWDKLSNFVSAYTTALDGLGLNEVSGLVTSEYGIHIIKCTDIFNAPDTVTDESQIPQDFVTVINGAIQSSNQTTAYNDWFTSYKATLDIVINPMPDNVPYNLDMTKYATSDQSTDTTGTDTTGTDTTGTDTTGTDATATDTTGTGDAATGTDTTATGGDTTADTSSGQPAETS